MFRYVPTDCPTREKHGWLGDAQVTAEAAMYVTASAIFFLFFPLFFISLETVQSPLPFCVPATRALIHRVFWAMFLTMLH